MKKGFIGPIGDDLPSIIAIMLALTIFFSGLSFSLNLYDEKMNSLRIFKGSLEIAKVFVTDGLVIESQLDILKKRASFPAATYGLGFKAGFEDDLSIQDCRDDNLDFVYSYLVTRDNGDLKPDNLRVCVGVLAEE